jgi:hypothetical protein
MTPYKFSVKYDFNIATGSFIVIDLNYENLSNKQTGDF